MTPIAKIVSHTWAPAFAIRPTYPDEEFTAGVVEYPQLQVVTHDGRILFRERQYTSPGQYEHVWFEFEVEPIPKTVPKMIHGRTNG